MGEGSRSISNGAWRRSGTDDRCRSCMRRASTMPAGTALFCPERAKADLNGCCWMFFWDSSKEDSHRCAPLRSASRTRVGHLTVPESGVKELWCTRLRTANINRLAGKVHIDAIERLRSCRCRNCLDIHKPAMDVH